MRIGWIRLTAAALALPALSALAGAWLLTAWADVLPDPVAVHFGPSGTADGFASLAAARASLLFGPAIAVLMVLLTGAWTRRDARTARPAVAVSSGVGTFVTALVVFATAPQRGLADAVAAQLTWWSIPAAAIAGLVAAVLAAMAVPRVDPEPVTAAPPPDATRLDLAAGERLAWIGTGRMPVLGTLLVALIPLAVAILLAITLPWSGGALVALALVALTGVVVTVLTAAPVEARADDTGVTVRSMFTLRPIRVPLDDIVRADVGPVRGIHRISFGYRLVPDGVLVNVRPGDALIVTRAGGSRLLVTVDDAAQGAAAINALAARARP